MLQTWCGWGTGTPAWIAGWKRARWTYSRAERAKDWPPTTLTTAQLLVVPLALMSHDITTFPVRPASCMSSGNSGWTLFSGTTPAERSGTEGPGGAGRAATNGAGFGVGGGVRVTVRIACGGGGCWIWMSGGGMYGGGGEVSTGGGGGGGGWRVRH